VTSDTVKHAFYQENSLVVQVFIAYIAMKFIVIGAGLAGSACAHALAVHGCDVTVLEASSTTALGSAASPSSGLPAALMAPHHGAASNPITQLSHLGIAATLQAARTLLVQGRDWQPCGTLQRAGKLGPQAHWFSDAAWVKPAALVAAWLAHPRISVLAGAAVQHLQRASGTASGWQALNAQGSLLAQADATVLANAYQAKALLGALQLHHAADALHQVAGQVVYGPWDAQWQALWPTLLPELAQLRVVDNAVVTEPTATDYCAINGNGHFIPAVPLGHEDQRIWLSGSTYEHDSPHSPQITVQGAAANLQRLQQLIPGAAPLLAAQYKAGLLQGWAGARCTTRDRLPVVGAVSADAAHGLYVCSAMGSRGLSFAALCGQEIAARITVSSSALPDHLRRAIQPERFFDAPS
jgi:tRNA 5-methylaminomethyl-2-thiouridine biosynthesis bifunctional protein